jgi:hypothetical protein
VLRPRAKKAVFDAIELDAARSRDATRSSLRSRFGFAPIRPPFRKRSVMHDDLEIRASAESPGSAINQATRAHFANAIQRLKEERRYRVFIDLDRDATRFPTAVWRPNGSQEQREVTIWCSNDYLGWGVTQRYERLQLRPWSATGQALEALATSRVRIME